MKSTMNTHVIFVNMIFFCKLKTFWNVSYLSFEYFFLLLFAFSAHNTCLYVHVFERETERKKMRMLKIDEEKMCKCVANAKRD